MYAQTLNVEYEVSKRTPTVEDPSARTTYRKRRRVRVTEPECNQECLDEVRRGLAHSEKVEVEHLTVTGPQELVEPKKKPSGGASRSGPSGGGASRSTATTGAGASG